MRGWEMDELHREGVALARSSRRVRWFEPRAVTRRGGFPARTPALPASSLLLPCFGERKDAPSGSQLSEITRYSNRISCEQGLPHGDPSLYFSLLPGKPG